MSASVSESGAAARLRRDVDRGRTGDKVDWPDPASAPLGTDDEAGGVVSSAASIEHARQRELKERPHENPQRSRGPGAAWILIAVIVICAAAAAAAAWILS